jgi:hypothetical protein
LLIAVPGAGPGTSAAVVGIGTCHEKVSGADSESILVNERVRAVVISFVFIVLDT